MNLLRARALIAGAACLATLALAAPAHAKTTLACFGQPKAAPRTCVVFGLPGAVVPTLRISLRSVRWKQWGSRRATGSGRVLVRGKRVRVRLIADRRTSFTDGSKRFYSRLTLINRAGDRQSLNLDYLTENS